MPSWSSRCTGRLVKPPKGNTCRYRTSSEKVRHLVVMVGHPRRRCHTPNTDTQCSQEREWSSGVWTLAKHLVDEF